MNKPKGITIEIKGRTGTGKSTLANWIYKNIIDNGDTAIKVDGEDLYSIDQLKEEYDVIIIDRNGEWK